jgi:hypothetical protein
MNNKKLKVYHSRDWGCSSLGECLPSICEALSSTFQHCKILQNKFISLVLRRIHEEMKKEKRKEEESGSPN